MVGKVQKSYHHQNEVDKWGKSDKSSVFPDQVRVYCLVSDIWPSSAWKASHMLVDSSVETAYRGWKLPAILAFQKIPAFRPTANWDGRSTVELVMLQETPVLGNLRCKKHLLAGTWRYSYWNHKELKDISDITTHPLGWPSICSHGNIRYKGYVNPREDGLIRPVMKG